jgi:nucleotide-binding universal stress UspA family protein
MNDALPLLDRVERATVALLHGERDRVALDDGSTPSVLRQLHCHGIAASYEALPTDVGSDGLTPTDALLNLAFDLTADLVVMGARGRHGSPFPRAESRTREGLSAMAAPMLMSM